jgi:hypothetical protein
MIPHLPSLFSAFWEAGIIVSTLQRHGERGEDYSFEVKQTRDFEISR